MKKQGMSYQTQSPIHDSIKKSRVGKKNVKTHPKQSDLHGNLNF